MDVSDPNVTVLAASVLRPNLGSTLWPGTMMNVRGQRCVQSGGSWKGNTESRIKHG